MGEHIEIEDAFVPDISTIDLRKELATPNPANGEEFLRRKAKTSARLGVWRAGARYRTETLLRFRADHAAAMDAVFSDVSDEFLAKNNLVSVSTVCQSKDEFLTHPDLGGQFSPESVACIKKICAPNPRVLVYASDGLSSTAVEANFEDTYLSIKQGLEVYGIECGTPFFVKYGGVRAMDVITQALNAEVVIVLLGERPGLVTGESMSAYISYKGYPGMPEVHRIVVSNIHRDGTTPVEGGAHIAHIAYEWLQQKVESGMELKL